MSGIDISDELLALYDQLKIKKAYKHISFTLAKTGTAAGKDVYGWTILEKGDPQPDDANEANFKAMVKSLPEGEPRFVVYDFTETKADGRLIKKLVLIKWCPDTVSFRLKPVIGASYQTLKEKLQGLGKDIQAADTSDLDYEAIKKVLC